MREVKDQNVENDRVKRRGGTKLQAPTPPPRRERTAPVSEAHQEKPKAQRAPQEERKEKQEERISRKEARRAERGKAHVARETQPPLEETPLSTTKERKGTFHQVFPFVLFWIALFALTCFVLELYGKGSAVGVLGGWFSGFLCGLFGPIAYALPFVLMVLAFRWRRFVARRILAKRLILTFLFFSLLSGIVHVFLDGDSVRVTVEAGVLYAGGMARHGGGLVGGFLGEWIGFCLRPVGTCLLVVPVLLLIGIYMVGLTPTDLYQRIKCRIELARRPVPARTSRTSIHADGEDDGADAGNPAEPQAPVWRNPRPLDGEEKPGYDFGENEPDVVAEPPISERARRREEEKRQAEADKRRRKAMYEMYGKEEKKPQPTPPVTPEVLDLPDDVPEMPDTPTPAPRPDPTIHSYRDRKPAAEEPKPAPKPSDNYYAPFALPVRPEPKREKTDNSSRIVITPHALPEEDVPVPSGILPAEDVDTPFAVATDGEEAAPAPAPVEEELGLRPASDEEELPMEEGISDPDFPGAGSENMLFATPVEELPQEPKPTPSPAKSVPQTKERVIPMAPKPTVLTATAPAEEPEPEPIVYTVPPVTLLNEDQGVHGDFYDEMEDKKERLRQTLADFGLRIQERIDCFHGPSITRYEFAPEAGVSVRSIQNRIDDISLSMGAHVRIEGLVMGKRSIGVEVPNRVRETVYMRTVLEDPAFLDSKKPLEVPLGLDIGGTVQMCNLAAMPHLLIAGSTGSGKSVCINVILISLLYKTSPEDLRLILIDPKQVEFAPYEHIPHLYMPIITDMQRAAGALSCAVQEMERRFSLFKDVGVRELDSYNEMVKNDPEREHLPRIIIVIDEFADLKMSCSNNDPETFTCRIAQKARAAGIHLIIGTQRPSVDVITGKLKTNIASRIAFTVKQQVDSRTILDINGAETLTGKGDMLYMPSGMMTPVRVQGPYVSDSEVGRVVSWVRSHNAPVQYNQAFMDQIEVEMAKAAKSDKKGMDDMDYDDDGGNEDPKFVEAVELAVETQKVATSLLQRRLGVGYGRAAKIIDRMEELGLVSAADGNKPRKVLPTAQGYLNHLGIGEDFEDDGLDG